MRRFGWCLLLLVLAAACGSAGSGGKAGAPSTTTSVPPASGLRGVAVPAFTCPPPVGTPSVKPAPIGTPRKLLLCALVMPGQPAKSVTISAGGTGFDALVAALSRADEPAPGPGTVCAAYADLTQVVLAETSAGVYQVSIPVDGCGHYERPALTALQAARAAG